MNYSVLLETFSILKSDLRLHEKSSIKSAIICNQPGYERLTGMA
jgi:hypothetical protein